TWTERVSFADDAAGTNRQLLGTFFFTESLAPSDPPLNRQESITLPTTGLSGPVYIVVEVDVFDSILEIDEQNLFASSATNTIPATLTLTTDASSITEGSASLEATVTRNGDVSGDLTVTITPSDSPQVTVPVQVIIPAGQYSKRFDVAAAVDGVVDGDVQVTITATAAGYTDGSVDVNVIDNDQSTLTLELSANELEEGDTVTATVTRDIRAATDLIINIASSDDSQLDAPLAVVLSEGETSVDFTLTVVDDTLAERQATYTVSVSAAGHFGAAAAVDIGQNDVPNLSLFLPGMLAEGSAGPAILCTVSRDVVTDRDLVVRLRSSDIALVTVPATVTIPAGQALATFGIVVGDDGDVNGSRSADITARVVPTAGGAAFDEGSATDSIDVLDNDGPTLSVSFDRDTLAEGGTTTATIRRNTTDTSQPLLVTLTSSDTTELTTVAEAEIPIGSQTVDVPVAGVEDDDVDGDQAVILVANTDGFNTGTGAIVVTDIDLPDLVISALTPASDTALTGEAIDVTWFIDNLGFATAEGTWTQRVFISNDDQAGDDTLAGQYTFTGPLPAGQSYDRTAPVTLPGGPGNYWVILETDVANVVAEGLETNNTRVTAGPITVVAAYTATVMTDVEMAPADTPVLLTGSAERPDGSAAAFEQVNVHLKVRGTKRVLSAITGVDGTYQITFTPLPGEGGAYTVGAAYPGLD
ncbi:MAG: CARDB domain-containing protein, partial [Pirellulales bacterium]